MKDKITQDMKEAMKARDSKRLMVIRGLIAAIKQIEIDTREEVDEAGVIAVVQKEIKKRKDALTFAEQGGREDLIEQNKEEISVLEVYLPAQLSEEELRAKIQTLLDGGANNIGAVMGALNKDHKGSFDGKTASTIARELLG